MCSVMMLPYFPAMTGEGHGRKEIFLRMNVERWDPLTYGKKIRHKIGRYKNIGGKHNDHGNILFTFNNCKEPTKTMWGYMIRMKNYIQEILEVLSKDKIL